MDSSVFICSHFFFFSFFIWVYDVFKASPLLGSDGLRPPCPAVLGSSLRSTGICHPIQLKLSYRITDMLLPKSIFPGWNGSLRKTSHTPRATAAFPTSLLYYFGTQVPEGSGVPWWSCQSPQPLSLLLKHWFFGALHSECYHFSVKVWCLWCL